MDAEPPTAPTLTDAGNAQRFAARHGPDVRYCYRWRSWFVWDTHRWVRDDGDKVMARAKETARALYAEAAAEGDEHRRKALGLWARVSEGAERLKALLTLAQSEPGIPVTPDQLDADPYLFNCANGTVDLRTGIVREARREHFITKLTPVAYDPKAPCPRWTACLHRILAGQEPVIAFIQRAIGYALTGDTREQSLFVLWGRGANGKTTLVTTVYRQLGDYAVSTRPETLMEKRGDSIPNDVARLAGARYVIAVEGERGQRLAEGLVKRMSGGDPLTARFLHATPVITPSGWIVPNA